MNLDISALYRRYRSELLHHLQRLVQCPDAAQDLLHESYVILSRSAAVGAIEHPRGFLYRIAGNLALDHLRHNKIVDAHRTAWATHEAEPFPDAAEQLSAQQWRALLHQTSAELPPRCRDAFILHKLHGSSYRDIAKLLDISESAVEKHIIKGLAHCRRRLGVHFTPPYRDS